MADFTEKLIEHIKKHIVLYDMSHPDYKNVRIKNKVWDEMAKDMGKHIGDDLKKRWKNLRDCFSKHLRSEKTRTGQAAKSICRYKTWPWAQQMDTFRPFLQFAVTDSNITDTDVVETPEIVGVVSEEIEACNIPNKATETSENLLSETSTNQEKSTKISYNRRSEKKRKSMEDSASNNSASVDKIITYLNEQHSDIKKNCSSIDLTFQGYAASVKKLSNRRQALVKYKIAKIIMEEELAQDTEIQDQSRPTTSYSIDSAASPYQSDMRSPYNNASSCESSNSCNIRESSNNNNSSTATWYEDFCRSNI